MSKAKMEKSSSEEMLITQKYDKRSRLGEIWHRMKQNKGSIVGLCIVVALILTMFASLIFISYDDVTAMNSSNRFAQPSLKHPFGTDDKGRDLFLRTLYGTRYSLVIGVAAVAVALTLGLLFGATAGFFGGIVEDVIMRAADILSSIPATLLGMVIVITLGQSLMNLVLAISVTATPAFIRITRASVLTVKTNEFVEAARSIGISNIRIIFTQVVPNGLSPVIVTMTTRIGGAILESAGLSFLGFGIPVPEPEWGALVSAGRNFIRIAPHLTIFPGIFIMITVLAFNTMGDGLRDALDPKLKR